jgi:hypothetical protein
MTFSGVELIITEKNIIFNNKTLDSLSNYKAVGISHKKNHIIFAQSNNGKLNLFDLTSQKEISTNINSDAVMSFNGIIYSKIGGNIVEIQFIETGADITPTSKVMCQTMENATTFFDGAAFQNMLGSFYVTLFPSVGLSYQVNIKELKSYTKILDAKYDNKVLFVVAIDSKGKTDQLIIRFNEKFDEYDIRKHTDIVFSGINFIVLENGICVSINPTEQVEIFSNSIHSQNLKLIDDPIISNDMKLFKNGTKVLFATDNKLYRLSVK